MGVKDKNAIACRNSAGVSIPFSSGHGGKGNRTCPCGKGGKFLSLFHQVMGVKKGDGMNADAKKIVSIPFSSGHGGKGREK